MKKIVSDSHDFRHIIECDGVYVDKTGLLCDLVSSEKGSRFFISRPRRFGKSLMLSTLAAIFNGERELFKGLEIERRNYDFQKFPVVQLDMSGVLAADPHGLEQNLSAKVSELSERFGLKTRRTDYATAGAYFGAMLCDLYEEQKSRLVVLVDEYDSPVNRFLKGGAELQKTRELLHDFYVQLKVNDDKIRFIMMTGVSKFAKLSIFSGLNNLKDLTLLPWCAGLLGYTLDEIRTYFPEHIRECARQGGRTEEEQLQELLRWYDGYRFSSRSEVKVTNPVSLGLALENRYIQDYWDATGNATVVYDHLQAKHIVPAALNGTIVSVQDLDVCDAENVRTATLLYQTGYLTIREVLSSGMLKLALPNREVDDAVHVGLLSHLIGNKAAAFIDNANRARSALSVRAGVPRDVIKRTLHAAFAMIPYEWKIQDEAEAKRMFLFYCKFIGADIVGEVQSSIGRADAVLRLSDAVYVFEFKYGTSSAVAMQQIKDRRYGDPYGGDGRDVILIGVNYNPTTRNIDDPIVEVCEFSDVGASGDESD